jgi:hypothetical protein
VHSNLSDLYHLSYLYTADNQHSTHFFTIHAQLKPVSSLLVLHSRLPLIDVDCLLQKLSFIFSCLPPGFRFILLATRASDLNAAWFELLSNANNTMQLGKIVSKIGMAFVFTYSIKCSLVQYPSLSLPG